MRVPGFRHRRRSQGSRRLAGWYKRNLLIYGSNPVRLIDSPQERILLLIGQGHAKLLSEYIAESPNLRLADPEQYLPLEDRTIGQCVVIPRYVFPPS